MGITLKSLDAKIEEQFGILFGEVAAMKARIDQLESQQTALPLPVPQAPRQAPVRSVPTNPMLGLLVRLAEYPDFETAKAAGLTYEQAKAKLDEWSQLFRGTPKPVQVKCVHCNVGHHASSAEVRACWAQHTGQQTLSS